MRYQAREAISLAFITALQTLPPRQRVVLVLRDVLGFRAWEVAGMLATTEESVTSASNAARATLEAKPYRSRGEPPLPDSPAERDLIERLTHAYKTNDLDGLVALLSDDVLLRMRPFLSNIAARDLAARFFAAVAFRTGRRFRLIPTRANGQPALGVYVNGQTADIFHATGILVLTLADGQVSVMTRFDNSALTYFGLPRTVVD